MPEYWLIPVTSLSPVTFGDERVRLSGQEAERFRQFVARIHPRLLLSFKSKLLISDEDDRCGPLGEEESLPLDALGPIIFNETLPLSHCGESLIDRLPSPKEALGWAGSAAGSLMNEEPYASWLALMIRWWSLGNRVMLLKEE